MLSNMPSNPLCRLEKRKGIGKERTKRENWLRKKCARCQQMTCAIILRTKQPMTQVIRLPLEVEALVKALRTIAERLARWKKEQLGRWVDRQCPLKIKAILTSKWWRILIQDSTKTLINSSRIKGWSTTSISSNRSMLKEGTVFIAMTDSVTIARGHCIRPPLEKSISVMTKIACSTTEVKVVRVRTRKIMKIAIRFLMKDTELKMAMGLHTLRVMSSKTLKGTEKSRCWKEDLRDRITWELRGKWGLISQTSGSTS